MCIWYINTRGKCKYYLKKLEYVLVSVKSNKEEKLQTNIYRKKHVWVIKENLLFSLSMMLKVSKSKTIKRCKIFGEKLNLFGIMWFFQKDTESTLISWVSRWWCLRFFEMSEELLAMINSSPKNSPIVQLGKWKRKYSNVVQNQFLDKVQQ